MSVTINAKGTSTPYFKIGKRGTTLFQGSTDPNTLYEPVDGDIWINNETNSLSVKSANNWIAPILGVTNPLIFPVSSGDNGQVLSTDGEGNLTWISSSGSGTVTSASVVSANGFAGTVANSTTTPAITISTSVTGLIKGNGTAISAATVGTDYSAGTASLNTGILKTTTGTGNLSIAVASDFPTLNQNTTGTANNVTGIVSTDHGGTGLTSFSANQIFYAGDANTISQSAGLTYNGANTLVIGSSGNATVFAGAGEALRLGSNSGNNIIILGAAGDLSFAGSVGTTGQVLTSQGANTSPTWTTITSGVSSFSGNSTGLTPNTATTGDIVLDGILNISHGGTGAITANEAFNNLVPSQVTNNGKYLTTNGANTSWSSVTTGTVTSISVNGTPNNIVSTGSPITSSGTITIDLANTSVVANTYTYASLTVDSYGRLTSATSNTPVTSFSAGTTGLTPNTATTGAVTLGGILNVSNGGTGASTLTGYVYGNGTGAFTANTAIPGSAINGEISGNANTATTLQTSRTISSTGDATWSVNFDGSSNVSSALTLATVNSSPQTDTFRKLTVNAKGLVTATSAVSQSDITTSLGYTPVNKAGDTMTGLLILSGDPVNVYGAVTKQYADNIASGVNIHAACDTATATALPACTYNNGASGVGATLTANSNGTLGSVGGYAGLIVGSRVLVKNQATTTQNGIYVVTQLGTAGTPWILTRSSDFDGTPTTEVQAGDLTYVQQGTSSGTQWVQITIGSGQGTPPAYNYVIVGTDPIVFTQFAGSGTYSAGSGINIDTNVISNSGVLSNLAGTGISLSGNTGNVTITNTGVTSLTGIANQITASASTGAVTLSLPSSVTISGILTANTFSGSGASLTNLSADNLTGTIPNTVLANSATFTSSTRGLTPASGGGSTNFLRADGTWASPPVTAAAGANTQIQYNNSGAFGANSNFTYTSSTNTLTVGTLSSLSGALAIKTPNVLTSSASGAINIQSGTSATGTTGSINISAGTTSGTKGSLNVTNTNTINLTAINTFNTTSAGINMDAGLGFSIESTSGTGGMFSTVRNGGTIQIDPAIGGPFLSDDKQNPTVLMGVTAGIGYVWGGQYPANSRIEFVPNITTSYSHPSRIQEGLGPQLDLGVLGKTMISMYAQTDDGDPPVYTPELSFFGASPVARPGPTASGTGNVLSSLVSSLNSLGLINAAGLTNVTTLSAAGSNTQVQYNSSGAFGASSNFTYNSGTNTLTVGTIAGTLTGNANTATTLQTSRTISSTGDATWSVNFDGSANATAALTLSTVATAGTYKSVTVDVKGRVTAGTNPTTLAGYGITDAVSSTGNSLPVTYGNISSAQLITSTTSANQVVDSFSTSTYRTVKYLVQATSSTSYQSSEIMIIHNGTTAFISEYGTVMTNTSLASFDADVSGGNVRLLVTPTNAVTTINVVRTTIIV
jgi:hypothetical protein